MLVTIYYACQGWTPVLYSDEGPEWTGFGYRYPWEAYQEAREFAADCNYPCEPLRFGICPLCYSHTVNDRCERCESVRLQRKIVELKKRRAELERNHVVEL